MSWGLVAAILAAICYGVASVLQAVAARATPAGEGVDPRLVVRVMRQTPFLLGLALDGAGFGFQFWALRSQPVFVVQAALAASLAVTAVVATMVLRLKLTGPQWAAVGAVCGGLALLGLSAGAESARHASTAFRIALLPTAVALGVAGLAALRLPVRARSAALGLVAGLAFGVVALAARSVTAFDPGRLVRDPAVYALVLAGAVAFVYLTTGLQRGAVTTVTAGLVIGETVLPSVLGVLVFGDGTRAGFGPVAVAGFALALGGCLALARFGSLEEPVGPA
ncbi:hypothetical protein R8Z50_15425 [Longispora sp. K20-0274]|uniref:hypothetical protein n=1 Tax=Longispora sp. K20-0274 TaxID=3088255 RepID=UPI00399C17BB